MTIFALVDCNNFYASCERAFNPRLEGKPVVVLSNNDGCVIARSNEAKKLGIPMGAPFFKWKSQCQRNGVQVFSSNYELYGDMSQRVMELLREHCPDMEIYSIDEAFLFLDGFAWKDLTTFMLELREKIKQYTGIPVSIGIGPTKTLAKVANKIAKTQATNYVYNLCDADAQEKMLTEFPVDRVWGIGYQLAKKIKKLNIYTAKDLRDANQKMMRSYFSVTVEKIVQELRGISCIGPEVLQPRNQIISSRSFGKAITNLTALEEAISYYAGIASLKLRKQNSVAGAMYVFVQTNIFQGEINRYENCTFIPFPTPTADTRYIIKVAKKSMRRLYKEGYKYHKAGLMLLDIASASQTNYDMLTETNPKSDLLMESVDLINKSMGKNTLFYCAEGIQRSWQIKAEKRSPRYTTKWDELVQAK